MRKNLKKTLALMFAFVLVLTSVNTREVFVSAEETEIFETIAVPDTQGGTELEAGVNAVWMTETFSETASENETEENQNVTQEEPMTEMTETKASDTEDCVTETTEETVPQTLEETEEETWMEAEKTEKNLVIYEPIHPQNGFSVTAAALEGVLPEGAYMVVSEISEGTEAYNEAGNELSKSQIPFDGFKAFDMTFYSSDGVQIEPEAGTVQVQVKLEADELPKEADTDTLAVRHHDASKGDVHIETVADTADGGVEVCGTEVIAEFDVESFSTFTITWKSNRTTYFEITVHYVNTNGEPIASATHEDMLIECDDEVVFADLKQSISGLAYKEARLGNALTGNVVTSMVALQDESDGWFGYTRSYNKINIYNGTGNQKYLVRTLSYRTDYLGNSETQKADIYLIYQTTTATTAPTIERSLSKSKTVTLNADDTYDLNLTISGAVGSTTDKAMIDVLLIVDKSGSMKYSLNTDTPTSSPNRRIDKVTDAVKALTKTFDENQNIDVRYSLVTFSESSLSSVALGWTSSSSQLNGAVSSISPDGGTNYQKGIMLAKSQLSQSRQNAEKVVIFLSDGEPTFREPDRPGGSEGGDGQHDNDGKNINAAVEEIKGLGANQFYCIGIGPNFQSGSGSSTARTNLNKLCENVGTSTSATRPSKTAVYTPSSVEDLLKTFEDIAGNVTRILCDHVVVTDTLSENVEVVLENSSGSLKKLELTVKASDGTVLYGPSQTVHVPATEENEAADISAVYADGKLMIKFPENYKLEPDWTYQLTTTIRATEKAYENYRNNGLSYSDYGDVETGTHAGSAGLYSNTLADVSYVYNGEAKNEVYPHPVVQIHPGTLVIEKTVTGLDEEMLEILELALEFEVNLNQQFSTVKLSQFTKLDGEAMKYRYVIEGISPDTVYQITEKNQLQDGFDLETQTEHTSGVIEKDSVHTASFANQYTPSFCELTVSKTVSGNMGDKKRSFEFILKIEKNGEPYTEAIDGLEKSETIAGGYVFELAHGESKIIAMPYGCDFELSEKEDYEGYQTTYVKDSEAATTSKTVEVSKLSEDMRIDFTNTKNMGTPTGILKDTMPYVVMVVGGMMVLFLFFARLRKRFE